MAGEAGQDVGGIAIGLALDTSAWSAGIARAKSDLRSLQESAGNLTVGARIPRGRTLASQAGTVGQSGVGLAPASAAPSVSPLFSVSGRAVRQLRTDINAELRNAAQQGQAVAIPVKLGRLPYASMRSEISAGIGEVPIKVTVGAVSPRARNILQAMLSYSTGSTMGEAQASIERAGASRGIPRRARGGYVRAMGGHVDSARYPTRVRGTPAEATPPIDTPVGERGIAYFNAYAKKRDYNFTRTLREAHRALSAEHISGGKQWYPAAGAYGRRIGAKYAPDLPEDKVIGVLAALSAGTAWKSNKTKFERVMKAYGRGEAFPYHVAGPGEKGLDAHKKAFDILTGRRSAEDAFSTSPKVGQFYRGLRGDLSTLTLDRWALRTATHGKLDKSGAGPIRTKIDTAWRKVAREFGLQPSESQAALWLLEKERSLAAGAKNFGGEIPDVAGMFEEGAFEEEDMKPIVRRAKRKRMGGRARRMRGGYCAGGGYACAGGAACTHRGRGGPAYRQVDPETFHRTLGMASQKWYKDPQGRKRRIGETVYTYPLDEYRDMRTYLDAGGQSGYAIKPDGDLVSVFNAGERGTGTGKRIVRSAIQRGASKLDAFDESGFLPGLYGKFGFRETGRDPWNPEYAPPGWRGGSPDVVYMSRTGKRRRRAGGGDVAGMPYIVGEIGRELFVPHHMTDMIPPDVFGQLPKRADGGMIEIGGSGPEMWTPPEDGWIIPNRLMSKVQHRAGGTPVRQDASGRWHDAQGHFTAPPPPSSPAAKAPTPPSAYEPLAGAAYAAAMRMPRPSGGTDLTGLKAAVAAATSPLSARRGSIAGRTAMTQEFLESIEREARGETGLMASRAPRMQLGTLFAHFAGRKTFEERRYEAGQAQKDVIKADREYVRSRATEKSLRQAYNTNLKSLAAATGDNREELMKSTAHQRDALKTSVEQSLQRRTELNEAKKTAAVKAKAGLPTPTSITENIASTAAGFTAWSVGMKVLDFALAVAMPALEKTADSLMGFEPTANRITTALGQQAQQMGGNVRAVVGGAALQAGLGAAGYAQAQLLGPSIAAKGGAMAAQQASDIRRAAYALAGGGAPAGLFGGYGGVGGGPLFAEQLGGGKGYTEILAGDIKEFARRGNVGQGLVPPSSILGPLSVAGGGVGQPAITSPVDVAKQKAALDSYHAAISDTNEAQVRGAAYLGQASKGLQLMTREAYDAKTGLSTLNDNWDQMTQGMKDAGKAAGDEANATDIASHGVVLLDQNNRQVVQSGKDYLKFFQQASQGQMIGTPEEFIAQRRQGLVAQREVANVQAQTNIQTLIPGKFALGLLADPFMKATAGITKGFKSQVADLGKTQQLMDQINDDAKAGLDSLYTFVGTNIGPAAVTELQGYVANIASAGADTLAINTKIAGLQVKLTDTQYAHNRKVMDRALSDARGLVTGIGPVTGNQANLGAIQRQQFELGQQSTALSLGMNQKQINFQRATAGFLSPEASGEERAAAIRLRTLQADYAQKQQNIAVAQFRLERPAFETQAARSYSDVQAESDILDQTYALEREQLSANKRITANNAVISTNMEKANEIIGQAQTNFSGSLSTAGEGLATFGKEVVDVNTMLIDVQKSLAETYGVAIPQHQGGAAYPGSKEGAGTNSSGQHAAGAVGLALGPQRAIFGEAGREAYAILRAPRMATMPSMGGSPISITINITGGVGRDSQDAERLARVIEDRIVRSLGRRAAQQGLRSP